MTFFKRVPKTLMFLVLLLPFFITSHALNTSTNRFTNLRIPNATSFNTYVPSSLITDNLVTSIKNLDIDFSNKQVVLVYHPTTDIYIMTLVETYQGDGFNYIVDGRSGTSPNFYWAMVNSYKQYRFNSNGIFTTYVDSSLTWPLSDLSFVYVNGLGYRGVTTVQETQVNDFYVLQWAANIQISNAFNSNGNQLLVDQLDVLNLGIDDVNQSVGEVNQSIKDMDNTIKDSDVGGASSDADNFFSGFDTDFGGLTSIVTAPLVLIQSMTSSCNDLNLPLGIVSGSLTLPCMSNIYSQYFGNFFTIYRTITDGMIAYGVVRSLFTLVQGFKNPEDSKIEVVDL